MKRLKTFVMLTILAMAGIGFYACNDNSDDNNSSVSQQDRDFSRTASQGNIAEIQFGQLATQKSVSDSVTAFARKLIADHTKSQAQLDSLGRKLNITKVDSMDANHRNLMSRLSGYSQYAFDTAYINSQVKDHQATITLFENQSNKGQDSGLKSYASKNLPALRQHLQMAQSLKTYLQNNNNNDNTNTGGGGKK
jgi:putative membrane protein